MGMHRYKVVVDDHPAIQRRDEAEALQRLLEMLAMAEAEGPHSSAAASALAMVNSVWSTLLEDLASPRNALPVEQRAQLISIGIQLLKEVQTIRSGASKEFGHLRAVIATIAEGLA
jgi:flagellar biosynthesis activator protein FlaF